MVCVYVYLLVLVLQTLLEVYNLLSTELLIIIYLLLLLLLKLCILFPFILTLSQVFLLHTF